MRRRPPACDTHRPIGSQVVQSFTDIRNMQHWGTTTRARKGLELIRSINGLSVLGLLMSGQQSSRSELNECRGWYHGDCGEWPWCTGRVAAVRCRGYNWGAGLRVDAAAVRIRSSIRARDLVNRAEERLIRIDRHKGARWAHGRVLRGDDREAPNDAARRARVHGPRVLGAARVGEVRT